MHFQKSGGTVTNVASLVGKQCCHVVGDGLLHGGSLANRIKEVGANNCGFSECDPHYQLYIIQIMRLSRILNGG